MRKKLYRCTFALSALNYCGEILFKSFSYLYEVGGKTFPPIFGLFAIFDSNFANIVAPSSDENENCVMRLKGLSILKKVENRIKIDPLTVTQYVFEPLERADRSMTKTPYFRTSSRRA